MPNDGREPDGTHDEEKKPAGGRTEALTDPGISPGADLPPPRPIDPNAPPVPPSHGGEAQSSAPEDEGGKRKGNGGSWAFGAVLAFLLGKGKAALLLFLKFGKPLISMAITVGAYAILYPWSFAIGFVALIFVHEMGHVWVAKRKGLPVSAPMFIPFLGAGVMMKRNPKDAATEADIALGGPYLGAAAAFVCYAIGVYTDSGVWHMLAYVGFFINLLNLVPMRPLDGGKIASAMNRWIWLAGVVIGPFVIWYTHSVIFVLIWVWFLFSTYRQFKAKKGEGPIHIAEGVYQAKADPALPDWYYRGSSHLRELPYTAYCKLDGQHVVEFEWEALSFRGELPIDQAILVRRVYAHQLEGPDSEQNLTLKVRVEGNVYEPDNYYEVKSRDRWRIGSLYVGLIMILVYMMWVIQEAGWTNPAQ
ncbi:site-2 protease family protein [Cohnella ginsengisoli]|uniref:Site-2 protease family protein n=1 Tax=Cohnella ginsengisoli TaxID=425004 RepID=A0A9X4QL70_9BACL|nr:site-2 protease family protein [Cohnella ginsengisoli]MDG0790399.1 site-2 protease family protein [Cohnella ginsengisoli]